MATITGGKLLAQRLAEIGKKLDSAKSVSAGVHAGSSYPDGPSVGLVAVVQEYGAPSRGIPPRPFMRPAVKQNASKWGDTIANAVMKGDYDAQAALELVGEQMKGDIQQSIEDVWSPPLKQATIDAKGSNKPLIDTHQMLNSVGYEVHE